MQLAKFTDYALRVLMHLAASDDHMLTTRQIAEIHDAKFNHLSKVTQWLVREGYVTSTRGRAGGLRLAQDPSAINIGRVIRDLEEGMPLVDCLGTDGGTCCLMPTCRLTGALARAQEAFFGALDDVTLADLTPKSSAFGTLLKQLNATETAT